jgi:predicted phage-related endonuclease
MSEATPAMAFGNLMEPVVADMFADQTGMLVMEDTNIYSHPEHPHMLANLDRLISTDGSGEPDAVLEIKTSRMQWDHVPAYYVSQIQHYMAVTGLQMAYCAALFGGEEYQCFEVPRDERYIEQLIEAEAEFWQSVTEHREPPIDGSKSTHDFLRKAHDPEQGKSVELDTELAEMLAWRAAAKDLVTQYEAEVREAESRIMNALQDAEAGTIEGKTVVTWKSQSRSSLDAKALKEAYPDIAAQFTKSNSFRVLRVK